VITSRFFFINTIYKAMRNVLLLIAPLLIASQLYSQKALVPDITPAELQEHISYLASDELAGRYPGTEGAKLSAEYIRNSFKDYGLTLLGNDGYQEFEIVVQLSPGENNILKIGEETFSRGEEFNPFPFSQSNSVKAAVVFVGYGFDIENDSITWKDYEGVDPYRKWVLILRGDPEMDKDDSPFALYGEDRDKVLKARDKGAAGVLMVSGVEFDADDELTSLYFDKTQSNAGLPVIHIKRSLANRILAETGKTVEEYEKEMINTMMPVSRELDVNVYAMAEILQEKVMARNVVGMVEGNDPVLKDSYVIIGAHYDHLGLGGQGSGSRFMDSTAIHNGADDNASGTAGVIELAGKLSANRESLKRSILFVAFDAEEQGLLGSKYFVNNPLVDLGNTKAMLNFDMIGRLNKDTRGVAIGGTGTSLESEDLLWDANEQNLDLGFSPEGYGPSDHAAFYAESIPVFFFSTGVHEDYHTPADDWQLINFEGEADVLEMIYNLVVDLADDPAMLTFQEAGPKERQGGRTGYRFKVTLGIMPDFTGGGDVKGLGVGGVKKDGPAYKGGMQNGDIIIAMDGLPVNDIYDYMNRLKKFKPGQRISVDVMREGKKEVLIIEF
jgi:hypothetical protein